VPSLAGLDLSRFCLPGTYEPGFLVPLLRGCKPCPPEIDCDSESDVNLLRWRSCFRGRLVVGRGHTGVLQCLVEREPHVLGGHGSIQFLSVHEDHGSRFHSHRFPFTHRGAHSLLILSLETCLQLRNVEIMFLSLQAGEFIEFRILPVAATFTADGTLIGVQVIGIIQ